MIFLHNAILVIYLIVILLSLYFHNLFILIALLEHILISLIVYRLVFIDKAIYLQ